MGWFRKEMGWFRKPDPASKDWEGDCYPGGDQKVNPPGFIKGGRNHITTESQLREAGKNMGMEGEALERRVKEVVRNQARRFN